MKDREFNLLEEPWVRVMRPDCAVAEVSLAEALLNAHEYVDLAGEMPTQDAAVLRVLLALLFAVFTRVDAEGHEAPFARPKDAIARWREIWTLGRFPEKPLRDYFARWLDRFWLFDPDHPFFQVPDKAWKRKAAGGERLGTAGNVAKLNGEVFAGGNKKRLFQSALENGGLTYSQAARWLIALVAWDDTALKPTEKGLPSAKTGWLGQLGYIQAQGKTLFETLMLNLTLLQDGAQKWDTKVCTEDEYLICPCWELENPRVGERVAIPQPKTPAALYTVQSRRIQLFRGLGKVTGFVMLAGDSFQQEDQLGKLLREQMTLWYDASGKANAPACYVPRRHDESKQFWREFPTAFAQQEGRKGRQPGIVRWLAALQRNGAFQQDRLVVFRVCALRYDHSASATVYDFFCDQLGFQARLLSKANTCIGVRSRVVEEIGLCEQVANAVGWLGHNLDMAAGTKEKVLPKQMNNAGKEAMVQFYYRVDRPFRQWLEALDPAGDVDQAIDDWRDTARGIALKLGDEFAWAAGSAAFVGREVKGKHLSTPEALCLFQGTIRKIYTKGA